MSKKPSSELAYARLRERILENSLMPGYQATEAEMASQLGMSRTPVHEALLRLQTEGLVEVRPRHGMRVLPLSVEDMREIYDILTSLESMAAGQIAARGLSQPELDELTRAVDEMGEALERDDLTAWAAADRHFHGLLVSFAGNARMQGLIKNFMDQSHRCRMLTLKLRPRPDKSNADHAAVVDAIRRRDAKTAERIHRQHRQKSADMLIELLEDLGLKQL